MQYEKINPMTRQEVEAAFRQQNSEEIATALLSATFHDNDWQWIQSYCLKFLDDPDKNVCAVAAICLGHLARIHRTIDVAIVVPALQAHLSNLDIAGRVSDALDDIEMFVKDHPHS